MEAITRRRFLAVTGAGIALSLGCRPNNSEQEPAPAAPELTGEWGEVRSKFDLDPEYIHMAGLLIASHPEQVQGSIREHRLPWTRIQLGTSRAFVDEKKRCARPLRGT